MQGSNHTAILQNMTNAIKAVQPMDPVALATWTEVDACVEELNSLVFLAS
jgi:hypothetical protein